MSSTDFKSIILSHKGQFFSVNFIKKDGTERTINGQVGMKKGHEGHNPVAHLEQYVTVVEKTNDGSVKFRNVNVDTITRLAVGGKIYTKEN